MMRAFLVLLLALTACEAPGGPEANGIRDAGVRRTKVEVLELTPRTFVEEIELVGETEAERDAVLSAQSSGTLKSLLALGTRVRSGRTVAQIDTGVVATTVRQAKAALEAARATDALAQETFKRQEPLRDQQIISALEFEQILAQRNQARAQLAQAEASLSQAREQLSNTRVVAPFDGTVEAHFSEVGEQVALGTQIARVTDNRVMKVQAGVPERYAADIVVGAPIRIRFDGYGFQERTSKLTFVGGTIDRSSRTFRVEARLDNSDGRLKPDMVTRLSLRRRAYEGALVVPIAAIVLDEAGPKVFIVEGRDFDATAQSRKVELGTSSGGEVNILSGVHAGDRVIVSGQQNLTPGDHVLVVSAS